MYKVVLCWRYLRTRYLALACVISVMLGVATLIVVNSVMAGFSSKLRERLHGLLSDVLIETTLFQGFQDPEEKIRWIQQSPVGDRIEAMTPTLEVMAMLQISYRGQMIPRPVHLIGIDPVGRARIGGFAEFLTDPARRARPSFELTESARQYHDLHFPPHLFPPGMEWEPENFPRRPGTPPVIPPLVPVTESANAAPLPEPQLPMPFVPKVSQGIILGYAIAHFRRPTGNPDAPFEEVCALPAGEEVIITTVGGQKLMPVFDSFVVADYFKSEMSEYDSHYVYMPLDQLQKLRAMEHRATAIQIKLKDYRSSKEVKEALKDMFPESAGYTVKTWEDKQGPLLSAIAIEKGILNVLLFLIIGVAGFGILAIFSMIVVEKTRDIGILKALGASNLGVMKIFLGYGLLLGVIGALLGTVLGIEFTVYINEIEMFLTRVTGQEVFPRNVYYFDKIPTDIQPWGVFWINVGAVGIAVVFSVLPALRAALLHPVRALRYE